MNQDEGFLEALEDMVDDLLVIEGRVGGRGPVTYRRLIPISGELAEQFDKDINEVMSCLCVQLGMDLDDEGNMVP